MAARGEYSHRTQPREIHQLSRGIRFAALFAMAAGSLLAAASAPHSGVASASAAAGGSAFAPRGVESDSLLRLAAQAMREGRPWRATEILSPLLSDSARRTPEAILAGARAANGWGGWGEVDRLLNGRPWLDSLNNGEGRAILARAHLGLAVGSGGAGQSFRVAAVVNALRAADLVVADSARGATMVLLARALAGVGDASGAASAYQRAALLIPEASEWLRLRAAEWIADSATRGSVLAGLSQPHVVARAGRIDAVAAENSGDTLGAIERYTRVGELTSAYRLRRATLVSAADSVSLRGDLFAVLSRPAPVANAAALVAILDSAFITFSGGENLVIARALGGGTSTRAAASYEAAFAAQVGNSADRFQYATLLARLGRNEQAIKEFEGVAEPPSLAAAAAYQRARTMLRTAQPEDWRAALRAVVREFPTDTSAATALFLLADLATDEGRDEAAREGFLESAARFPAGSRAPSSLFHAAMIAYVLGNFTVAASEFEAIRSRYPQSGEATAASYWRGRALGRAGDSLGIARSCSSIAVDDPMSYYAALCAARGHDSFRLPPAGVADSFQRLPSVDSVAQRVRVLRQLDLGAEVDLELTRIRALAGNDAEMMLSAASTLRELGYGSRAISLAQQAQARGAVRDARLFRLLYPSSYGSLVEVEAAQYGMDVDMLAGLIRQESLFNPSATSPAGARGLMQLMPALGGELARAFQFPLWDPVLLWQPDVNARMGVRHFADLVASQQHVYHVLASYNAGANRVTRWLTKRGTEDPEVFVERIPFVETRDYVRIVARNRETYRAMYRR